jgi:hypothetical protein
MSEQDLDEFGLPQHVAEPEREVTGQHTVSEITINLTEQIDVDSVRIILRCGYAIVLRELWQNGMVVCAVQTPKGQGQFAVLDPNHSGFNAMKVSVPTHVL